MGATIDEIIDSLKRGQGKRVSDLVKMALEEGTTCKRFWRKVFCPEWNK